MFSFFCYYVTIVTIIVMIVVWFRSSIGNISRQELLKADEGLAEEFENAKLDAHVQDMQVAYDARLKEKVKELLQQYSTCDGKDSMLQQTAKEEAQSARDAHLNLHCPHCSMVYAEFDGCMALVCSSCKKDFCGWCHKACSTSQGSHQHVTNCDLNLSASGSYYASSQEIINGQKMFRRNSLRRFLGNFKKELRNAIVFELAQDLRDLGMDPNGFYMLE